MNDWIVLDRSDRISTVRFNRPDKKNALTTDMYARTAAAMAEAEADPDIRAHLFFGVPGAFTAGNDIGDFLKVAMGGDHGEDVLHFLRGLVTSKKPIVAGVDGLAIGVGTTMLLHCDLVYATPRSLFKTPFLDLGLVPEAASSLIAPRLMGPQRAFELLCLGEGFDADRAREAGFVNAVVGEAELEAAAKAASQKLAQKPPEALAAARALLRGDGADVLQRIEDERRLFAERLKSAEARAAFERFMARG